MVAGKGKSKLATTKEDGEEEKVIEEKTDNGKATYTQQPQNMSFRRLTLKLEHTFLTRKVMWIGVVITILSFVTRFYSLDLPANVTWDEAHFGTFVNHYIKREFYFDVHPPLGKLMLAGVGYLDGYNGSFIFNEEGGPAYEGVKYMGMRRLCAALGAMLPTFIYGTMLNLHFSTKAAILSSLCILFDTGMLSLCRYILLDAPLLFFIALSIYSYTKFTTYSSRPFHYQWWKWLAITGASIACAFGVKWVGLFTIALIGVCTIVELWLMLGNQDCSLKTIGRHFMARALCLIVLPIIIYMSFFYVHISILSKSGTGTENMGSAFQSTLIGSDYYNSTSPKWVSYGGLISAQAQFVSGAILHSHDHSYPEGVGAMQQQITTYAILDQNSMWRVKHNETEDNDDQPIDYVLHGDIIRLEHATTGRNLHSHHLGAPLSAPQKQVTGYQQGAVGDSNDYWQILIDGEWTSPSKVAYLKKAGATSLDRFKIQYLKTKFRLVHVNSKCALSATGKVLPEWGFKQGEVACNFNHRGTGTIWSINAITDKRDIPVMHSSEAKPGFLEMFLEMNIMMNNVNNQLVPKPDEIPSRPVDWPLLTKGQHFNGFEDDKIRIYLLGNPFVWLGLCIPSIVIIASVMIPFILICQRLGWGSSLIFSHEISEKDTLLDLVHGIVRSGGFLLVGYALHFVPFFLMPRILYYHHYFPAQLFACMLVGCSFDMIVSMVTAVSTRLAVSHPARIGNLLLMVIIGGILAVFILFSPLSYGMMGKKADYGYLRWMDEWHINE